MNVWRWSTMDDEETSDVEEGTYRSKDHEMKLSKSRKQSSKESSTKKDGSRSKHGTTAYVCVCSFWAGHHHCLADTKLHCLAIGANLCEWLAIITELSLISLPLSLNPSSCLVWFSMPVWCLKNMCWMSYVDAIFTSEHYGTSDHFWHWTPQRPSL